MDLAPRGDVLLEQRIGSEAEVGWDCWLEVDASLLLLHREVVVLQKVIADEEMKDEGAAHGVLKLGMVLDATTCGVWAQTMNAE